ncbi:hypothetical protein RUND412_007179 [Rhizina undulata]
MSKSASPPLTSATPLLPASSSPPPYNAMPPTRSSSTTRIRRKTDLYLLPFLSLLFLLNSLDRSNVGNAETAGFTKHAGLQSKDLNDAVSAFFVTFVLLQPVGAALGKRVGVARWVGGVMIAWGILTGLNAFVRTRGQLITLRVMIGAFEAGFYPTTVFYLSLFYTRYEFAQRLGMFYGQYAVAGAFGGLVSYFVFRIFPNDPETEDRIIGDGAKQGWHSYQILFLLESVLTIIVAAITFIWLPRGPGDAWWLDKAERRWAERRIQLDRAGVDMSTLEEEEEIASSWEEEDPEHELGSSPDSDGRRKRRSYRQRVSSSLDLAFGEEAEGLIEPGSKNIHEVPKGGEPGLEWRDVIEAATDWKIYWILVVNILSSVPTMAFSIFLPLVIKGMGYNALSANLLTVPPFLCGAAVLWGMTWWSDKKRERIKFILLGLLINTFGLLLLTIIPAASYNLRYISLCILLAGTYIASPLTVAWISGNIPHTGKRAVTLGINGWGNLAGVISAELFAPRYAPDYEFSFRATLALVAISAVGYAGFGIALRRINGKRERMWREWTEQEREVERTWGRGPGWEKKWGKRGWERRGDDTVEWRYGL